ncbi:9117_t:CDS:2, partial [Dentiscutata erythropus]
MDLNNRIMVDDKVFKCPPQRKYREIRNTLKPNPPEYALYGIYPYEQLEFTLMGIRKLKENIGNIIGKVPKHNADAVTNYTYQKIIVPSARATPNTEDEEETMNKGPFEKGEDNFTNHPWWLEPLKTPSKRHYEEFNNLKDTYLCNSVWWE